MKDSVSHVSLLLTSKCPRIPPSAAVSQAQGEAGVCVWESSEASGVRPEGSEGAGRHTQAWAQLPQLRTRGVVRFSQQRPRFRALLFPNVVWLYFPPLLQHSQCIWTYTRYDAMQGPWEWHLPVVRDAAGRGDAFGLLCTGLNPRATAVHLSALPETFRGSRVSGSF